MNRTLMVCACLVAAIARPAAASGQGRDEHVSFRSGTVTLAGTVTVPVGAGPFPAVVLLSGSGPQNRDSEAAGFKPFKAIADDFAGRGIAVLRFDDRGVGASTGSLVESTTEDLADDALAAVRALRARGDIDGRRLGLVGHSEGAVVAAVAAARSRDVGFVVWLAGHVVSGAEILRMQAEGLARGAGAPPSAVEEILRHHDALIAAVKEHAPAETLMSIARPLMALQTGIASRAPGAATSEADPKAERFLAQSVAMLQTPWMRFFVTFNPADVLRRVMCPVFAAFGGRDVQVPAATNRPRLQAALAEAGNQHVTVRIYPDANHLFMPAITGQIAEYSTLPKAFVPSLLDDIASWINGPRLVATMPSHPVSQDPPSRVGAMSRN